MIGQPCSYLSSDHLDRAGVASGVAGRRGEMRTLPFIASCSLGKVGEITPTFQSTYPQALKSACHWQQQRWPQRPFISVTSESAVFPLEVSENHLNELYSVGAELRGTRQSTCVLTIWTLPNQPRYTGLCGD
ncbi:hypothetical protein PoB_007015600 [Plakobranchus ocellatus]|uniref:Uncharacterized protein n=1 Tax=Plakobranchus ocellatus TaxID=259542 RepID=A0AAV4DIG5_9GAST|nr:hypothetical protein PoB_007015600 [Plakobranchus ocellatus]